MAYIRIPHILRSTHEPRDGDVNLLKKIPLLVLEYGNIEEHYALDAGIAVSRRHGLKATAAMSGCRYPLSIHVPVYRCSAVHCPVDRFPHVCYHGLDAATSATRGTIGGNDVSVTRDLDQEVPVLGTVRLARAVTPGYKGHRDIGRGDGRIDGMVWQGRVSSHLSRVGTRPRGLLPEVYGRLWSHISRVVASACKVLRKILEADAEYAPGDGVVTGFGEIPGRRLEGLLALAQLVS